MSTFNGFGTMYYGWRHNADGTAFATKWLVGMWVPLIPLARHQICILTDLGRPEPFLQVEQEGFLKGLPVQYTHYRLLASASPVLREVLATYAWTYALGPILMGWPIVAMRGFGELIDEHPHWRDSTATLIVLVLLGVLVVANPIFVALHAIRRARGERSAVSYALNSGRIMKTYEIDGANFDSLDGFYDEFSHKVIPDAAWGRNWAAFNDVLFGGFGTPAGGFTLVWRNSQLSRERLGREETIRNLHQKLRTCHSTARDDVRREISIAERGEGPTLFDELVELIESHGVGTTFGDEPAEVTLVLA